ncbi:hypothetical protein LTR39_003628, partial [Cryomyces antarcticus]
GEGDEGDEDDYDDHDDGHYDDHDNDKSNSGKQLVRYSASDRDYSDTASRRSRSTVRHAPRTERSYRPSERSYRNSHCDSYGDYDGGASRRTGNSGKQLIRNHGGSNSRPASIYSGAISHRNRNRNSSKRLARYSASDRNYSGATSQATRSNHDRSSCSNAGKHLTRYRAPSPTTILRSHATRVRAAFSSALISTASSRHHSGHHSGNASSRNSGHSTRDSHRSGDYAVATITTTRLVKRPRTWLR